MEEQKEQQENKDFDVSVFENYKNTPVHNVLVIDDDKMIQSVFRKFLESWGFKVYSSLEPYEGIALAVSTSPSFIILDIYLPELSGEKILKILKKIDITSNTPIIIVSGNLNWELLNSTYREGASGFLSKPFTKEDLINNIKRVISPSALSKIDFNYKKIENG
jgi:DNA-binding NtrC family response regulator